VSFTFLSRSEVPPMTRGKRRRKVRDYTTSCLTVSGTFKHDLTQEPRPLEEEEEEESPVTFRFLSHSCMWRGDTGEATPPHTHTHTHTTRIHTHIHTPTHTFCLYNSSWWCGGLCASDLLTFSFSHTHTHRCEHTRGSEVCNFPVQLCDPEVPP